MGDAGAILPELPAESVDLILTDPPYGVNYQSNRRPKDERFPRILNDANLDWAPHILSECHRILKPDRQAYFFCTWRTFAKWDEIIRRSPFEKVLGVFVWDKMVHGSGDLYGGLAVATEWIIFLSKGRRLWDRDFPSVYGGIKGGSPSAQRNRPADIIQIPRISPQLLHHPAQKPVELYRYLIELSTEPGELVCDPFAGTFTAARACKTQSSIVFPDRRLSDKQPRDYFCIELDPDYERFISGGPNESLFSSTNEQGKGLQPLV